MSSALHSSAEVEKLARCLAAEPERLAALEACPPKALRKLRHQVADHLLEADRTAFSRAAAASSSVPAAVAAKMSEKALGPLLTARVAALVDEDRIFGIVKRLPDEFLAEVALELDPRHARHVLLSIPPERMADVAAELDERGEHVAMSGFCAHITPDALSAVVDVLSPDGLLRVGYLLEAPERLDGIVAGLSDERLTAVVELAETEGREEELAGICQHLKPRQRRRVEAVAQPA
jgi:hypothetical protein